MPRSRVLHGDCRRVLARLEPDQFSACVTDPPYHLTSIVKRFGAKGAAPAKHGKDGSFARLSTGFMGKQWDGGDVAQDPETWTAVLRVMKPGAHLVAFGGTRTFHRMACAIEDAGFEIRDTLMWLYGSGFPKSHNGPWGGSALKPAWEPIILARKPLDGTIAKNVLAHGTGGLNIDACRVSFRGEADQARAITGQGTRDRIYGGGRGLRPEELGTQQFVPNPAGRWPANVLHDGSDEVEAAFAAFGNRPGQMARTNTNGTYKTNAIYGKMKHDPEPHEPRGDSGTASRFFYCTKANAADRAGSSHPTVKPLALMRWLVTLVAPPGGTILDPFAGSGTTLRACRELGLASLGVELEAEYVADIKRRLRVAA